MKILLSNLIAILLVGSLFSQAFVQPAKPKVKLVQQQFLFKNDKSINYQKVKIAELKDTAVKGKGVQIVLDGIKGMGKSLNKIQIFEQEGKTESSQIIFFHENKIVQKLFVPYWFRHVQSSADIADFNGDGIPDIKIRIFTGGNGSAALLNYKVFLISQSNKYRVFSFVDFSSEKEYDFNKDGIAEIIGCTTTNYKGHNYWVYNLYNWKNGALAMVSKEYGYPIWTRVDNKTNKLIASDIPDDIRMSTLRSFPTEYFVR